MLGEGRGLLVPFRDPEAMARALDQLLSNPEEWDRLRRAAYARGREMAWPIVGARYLELFRQVLERPRPGLRPAWLPARPLRLPAVRLEHLRWLTDDTGMLQHARFTIPDRRFGYCTDDNARALLFTVRGMAADRRGLVAPVDGGLPGFPPVCLEPGDAAFSEFHGL
jgi:hypothetical protein